MNNFKAQFFSFLLFFLLHNSVAAVSLNNVTDNIFKYGFNVSLKYCKQLRNTVECNLSFVNITNQDLDFAMSPHHLLIDDKGYQYKRVSTWQVGKEISYGGGNGIVAVPNIKMSTKVIFKNIVGRSSYLPRLYIDWFSGKCPRIGGCPHIRIKNIKLR